MELADTLDEDDNDSDSSAASTTSTMSNAHTSNIGVGVEDFIFRILTNDEQKSPMSWLSTRMPIAVPEEQENKEPIENTSGVPT